MRFGLSNGEPNRLEEIGKRLRRDARANPSGRNEGYDHAPVSIRRRVLRPYLYGADDLPTHQPEADKEKVTAVAEQVPPRAAGSNESHSKA